MRHLLKPDPPRVSLIPVQTLDNRLEVTLASQFRAGQRVVSCKAVSFVLLRFFMAHSPETTTASSASGSEDREIVILADVCFEMFPIKELRRPHLIMDELRTAFPDFDEPEILKAISMALSWRILLRAAGRPLH